MPEEQPPVPDVDRLVRSMLQLHGDDHDDAPPRSDGSGSWSKSRDFTDDPQCAAAVAAASRADRERYLTSGLLPVDCRFCHVTVAVRRLGPGHTAVQWSTDAWERCAHFTAVRESGGDTARVKSCPKLSDSIEHAVAEGYLDAAPDDH